MNDPVLRAATAAATVAPDESTSAVSWPAVLAGAVAAASLSLILLVLGAGFGFTSISPWHASANSGATFGLTSILWVTLTALFASALGGYIAGRLRTRWIGTHVDEVYFRDTAHGFLAWGVATLITAGVLSSAVGSILGSAADAGASLTGAAATVAGGAAVATRAGNGGNTDNASLGYFTDSLFRRDATAPVDPSGATAGNTAANAPVPVAEVGRIFVRSLQSGSLTSADTRYVAQLVAQRTGLSQADAEKRVTDVYGSAKAATDEAIAKAREAADKAAKAAASASFWIFVSLLLGAFGASLAATFGGRQRDL